MTVMQSRLNKKFQINDVVVDPVKNIIFAKDKEVEISPRAIQILQLLVERAGELVTYQEIEERIWKGYNSQTSLYQQVASLRKALGDNSTHPTFIKTVSKQGYQFVGDLVPLENEKKVSSKTKLIHPIYLLVICAVIGIAFSFQYVNNNEKNSRDFQERLMATAQKIQMPETVVAIEIHQEQGNIENKPLLNTIAFVVKHHLEKKESQHAVYIPSFTQVESFQRLTEHFLGNGQLTAVYRPFAVRDGTKIRYGLKRVSVADGNEMDYVSVEIDGDAAGNIHVFEQLLVRKLKSERFMDGERRALLSNNSNANRSFIAAMDVTLDKFNEVNRLENAIARIKDAIDAGQDNLIAYSALWDMIFLLMNQQNKYNVEGALVLAKETSDLAKQLDPDYFKSYYAGAEYYCRIFEYESCIEQIAMAIERKPPFGSGPLGNLRFNLLQSQQDRLEITKLNYLLNPFTINTSIFYRNELLGQQRFNEAVKLIEYVAHWESSQGDWHLLAQTKTSASELERLSKWYFSRSLDVVKKIQEGDGMSGGRRGLPTGVSVSDLPTKYIGYMLLNANKPDLARYWSANGKEANLPYFDIRIINILADIWEGKWDKKEWDETRRYADARREFQNHLDKMYIAYFDYINGQQSLSGEYIEEIFPEFAKPNFEVTRDNFRHAVYYNEVKKHIGDHSRVISLEHALRQFLQNYPIEANRDVDFGIADAEFYALNNDHEKAIATLIEAIEKQGWLPNAFWLWPPIDHNPFLATLYNEPEFIELAKSSRQKMDHLCFERDCLNR